MIKPPSIARFEQFYWGSLVIGWINSALNWKTSQAALDANPLLANARWFLPAMTLVGVLIAVALWFFIARKASVVAKWIQVVFAAFGAFGILSAVYLIATGKAPSVLAVVIGVAANILYIAAATMLFRPDAKEWFGEGRDVEEDAPLV